MLNLNNINNLENISNKAYNLALLKQNNFNVAEGYLLFEKDLNNINTLILPFDKVAVRSSALGEDGVNNSFAGIFKSILNVTSETYEQALKEVYDSFYSKKSEIYQKLKNISITPQILIQEMVESKYSIVIFIKDNDVTLSLTNGSCEKIVSGNSETEELNFKLNEDFDNILNPYNDIKLNTFINNDIKRIIKLLKVEKNTLDVEATFDGNKWWILQARIYNL